MILATARKNYAGGSQKHMEVVSLDVLRSLKQKNSKMTIEAIGELTMKQIDYIVAIALDYDPQFGQELEAQVRK